MIYSYKLDNDIIYIPIHLNLVFQNQEIYKQKKEAKEVNIEKYKLCHFSEEISAGIKEVIENMSNNVYIILDFSEVQSIGSFAIFSDIGKVETTKLEKLIIINTIPHVKNQIIGTELKDKVKEEENIILCSTLKTKSIKEVKKIVNGLEEKKGNYIDDILLNNIDEKKTELSSSNVVANKYVNIKKIFTKEDEYIFLIYNLSKEIMQTFDGKDKVDYLVCVSNNGAVLSTMLSSILGIGVSYLMNLGPNLGIADKKQIKLLESSKNYLFIYDFICLGSEYKIIKSLLKYKNCNFLGGAGIALYKRPKLDSEEEKILSLVNVKNKKFKYKLSLE